MENAENAANPGKPAFGLLGEDGSYQLTTYENDDGAVVGKHWVALVNLTRKADKQQAESAVAEYRADIYSSHRATTGNSCSRTREPDRYQALGKGGRSIRRRR